MAEITLTVEELTPDVDLSVEDDDSLDLGVGEVVEITTSDYEKLNNLPKINGTTLIGNYDEIDPTVPDWAKDTEPEEMTQTSVEFIWASIFK